jgi:protein-S-isoprenylcysteine O-methyltransferase Ste14
MLTEEMSKQGSFLFRWRSYLPLLGSPLVLLAMVSFHYPFGSHSYDTLWELFCFGVSLSGLAIRALTIGFVPPGTSGRNTKCQKTTRLNTTGAYSLVRHPLYLSNFVIVMGGSLFVRSFWLCLVVALGFVLYYERIIYAEESFLLDKFGSEFSEWARRTPLIVPSFKSYTPPDRPFDWRMALRREYSGFFGIVATFTFLEMLGDYIVRGVPVVDPLWIIIFAAGLVTYLTLMFLKKKTSVLTPRCEVAQEAPSEVKPFPVGNKPL